ncbi:MAG TPA: cytochrome P450 [Segeticoccus sp.]|uniref:cytochrome P450 n=1 Tax=Segeticoccus sp. TaxID=2706531 RepID=UPI002D7EA47E|nr:cytochrome P450 [Segeticoccus sp.]HET8599211.1 cytochrome P450 [Segeticoccus sp.]
MSGTEGQVAWRDDTLGLLADPYGFISSRARRVRRDVFTTRLLGRPVTCLTGPAAARFFYDEDHVVREGAAPGRVLDTLFGRGGVQGLDGEAHRHRKAMFMSLMTPEALDRLEQRFLEIWRQRARSWEGRTRVVLFDEVNEALCHAVCAWSGVRLDSLELRRLTRWMAAMIDAPAAVGPRHWQGRRARGRAEQWAAGLIERERARGESPDGQATALAVIARHRDADGTPLSLHDAAVELLNVVRPTVAVGRFVVLAAQVLHTHPAERDRILASDDPGLLERFVQEVRRDARFFPMVPGIAAADLSWRDEPIPRGRWLLLDLHGIDHDPGVWGDPERFRPDRFVDRELDPFEMVPQGGGGHWTDHRCAGEWITIRLMVAALRVLVHEVTYAVPPQDLSIPPRRAPTLPRSGFVITEVRPRAAAH